MAETRRNRYWAIAIVLLIVVIIITVYIAWSSYQPAPPSRLFCPRNKKLTAILTLAARRECRHLPVFQQRYG